MFFYYTYKACKDEMFIQALRHETGTMFQLKTACIILFLQSAVCTRYCYLIVETIPAHPPPPPRKVLSLVSTVNKLSLKL